MSSLFDIKCRNCGSPVGYDIVSQSYRCPHCGEISGIREVRQQAEMKRLQNLDRRAIRSSRQVCSCPGCGAEVLYEAGEENQVCSFCGASLVRREFEESDQFPQYIIPFVLTKEEAQKQLTDYLDQPDCQAQGHLFREHIGELQGFYLPYSLVRGPVGGYVRREHVRREFRVRGFVESALINTSRQMDNEILDAAEPFDLEGLKPFEHGFIAGHKVKLADLSGAKRERRTLQEAAAVLKPQLVKTFHTQGIRVNLNRSELLEIPVLLPMYILKVGRKLAVVNGQTGRVAMKTGEVQSRSRLWMLEPAAIGLMILLLLWLITGNPLVALIASPPLLIALAGEYQGGRFSVFRNVIHRSEKTRARRVEKALEVTGDPVLAPNPFPVTPVFEEPENGKMADVIYEFYPVRRVLGLICKVLGLYFLPTLIGAFFHFVLEKGAHFRIIGGIPWFWCFGIFCVVYVFSGIRCDAYEHPFIYRLANGRKGGLLGPAACRKLPFLRCIGLDLKSADALAAAGFPKQKLLAMYWIAAGLLLISVCCTIL